MINKTLIVFTMVFAILGIAYCQWTYYYSDGSGNAAWWTQHSDPSTEIRGEVVDSTTASSTFLGKFGIGGESPAFIQLTRNFHWPYSLAGQNFVLFVDGTYFTNGGSYDGMLCGIPQTVYYLDSTYFVSSDTSTISGEKVITSHWRIPIGLGFIDVYQELMPISLPIHIGEIDTNLGLMRIKYRVINGDLVSHQIGIKLFMDILVDGNDAPDVALGPTYSPNSIWVQGIDVPGYWQAYKDYWDETAVVARGLLRGMDCTPPDIFAIGQGPAALGTKLWIIPTSGCNPDSALWASFLGWGTMDVAAVLQWEPFSLDAGAYRDYITYYGFGLPRMPTTPIIVSPTTVPIGFVCDSLDSINLFTTAISQEDPSSFTYYSDTICIYPPSPFTIDTVIWIDTLVGGGIISLGDTACIHFDSLLAWEVPVNVVWTINVPSGLTSTGFSDSICYYANSPDVSESTYQCIPYPSPPIPAVSGTGPIISFASVNPYFVNCCSLTVDVEYTSAETIDVSSFIPIINGSPSTEYLVTPLPSDPNHGTFQIQLPCSMFFADETLNIVAPSPQDIYGCNEYDTLRTTIVLDTTRPQVEDLAPCDTIITESSPSISFSIWDSISGVRLDSLIFTIQIGDNTPVSYRPGMPEVGTFSTDSLYYTIVFTPSSPFPSETTVCAAIVYATDYVQTCSSNVIMDTTSCCFLVDYTPPRVEFISPPESAFISCDTPLVCMTITDLNGFDTFSPSNFEVDINGIPYFADDFFMTIDTLDSTTYQVCIEDAYNYPYGSGDVVLVEIVLLSDTVGNSIAVVDSYWFFMDLEGPQVFGPTPSDSSFIPEPDGSAICSLSVVDVLTGVLDSAIVITYTIYPSGITGTLVDSTDFHINADGTYLILHPTMSLNYLDTVVFCVDTLFDNAEVCERNNIASPFCVTYVIDNMPPEAWLDYPPEGAHSACCAGGQICIKFSDISGFNRDSTMISVGGATVPAAMWAWFPDDSLLCGTVPPTASCDSACGRMEIIILKVADSLGNTAFNSDTFFYIVDLEEPYVTFVYPPDLSTRDYDSVAIGFQDDCSWLRQSAICVEICHFRRDISVWECDTIYGDDPAILWTVDSATSADTMIFYLNDVMTTAWASGDSAHLCVICLSDSLDVDECGYNQIDEADTACWKFHLSSGGPTFSLVCPPNESFISCTDSFTVVFTCQDPDGVNPDSVIMAYEYNAGGVNYIGYPNPSILFVDGGDTIAPDTVYFTPPFPPLSDGDVLYVEFNYATDVYGIPSSASRGATYYVDQTAPTLLSFSPAAGTVLREPSPIVWAAVADYDAGLDYESLCFTITGVGTYCYDTLAGIVYWGVGDTAFFDTDAAGLSFCGGDTIEVCVSVSDATVPIEFADTTICLPNELYSCWNFTFATGAPIVVPTQPQDGWIVSCPSLDSLVVAASDTDGVDWSTFHITIFACTETLDYTYPVNMHTYGGNMVITPTPAITCEGTVRVSATVEDNLCNDSTAIYSFIIDHTPPEVVDYFPACDSLSYIIPGSLSVFAYDSLSHLDPSAICVAIITAAGETVSVCGDTSAAITNSGDTMFVWLDSLGIAYTGGDTICWWIAQLADYSDLCAPNYNTDDVGNLCCFEISSQGPLITLLSPDPGDDGVLFIGCDFPFTFVFRIFDEDGFDESTLRLIYTCGADAETLSYPDVDLVLAGDTLYWTPIADPCTECDTFHIRIEVQDNLSNDEIPNDFPVAIDRTPPSFDVLSTIYGDVFTITPICSLYFPDNCAGTDTSSVCCSLYSVISGWTTTICNIDDIIQWSGDTMFLYTTTFDSIQAQDTLIICVQQASDNVDTCVNTVSIDSCYWLYIAQFGPIATFIEPLPGCPELACPSDSVVVVFYDPDTLDTSTVHFEVDYIGEIPIGTNPYWINDTTLVYHPPPFAASPVTITIWGQADMLGYVGTSRQLQLCFDLYTPDAAWLSPGAPLPSTIPAGVPDIILDLTDSLNAIDSTTIIFIVHSDTYLVSTDTLEWFRDSDSLVYSASAVFDTFFAGDTFDICLTAGDSTGCGFSNILDTCWTVAVSEGEGPVPSLSVPSRDGATIACTDSFAIAWFCDDPEGLRSAGAEVSMRINLGTETIYDDASGHIAYSDAGDTLFFILPDTISPLSDGDSIFVRVIRIEDGLGNVSEDTIEYTFYIDWSGPEIVDAGPVGDVVIPSPEMWFVLEDISGVDTLTAVVSIWVNGSLLSTLHWPSPGALEWREPDSLIILGFRFNGGDTVDVCLDSIADSPDLCGPNWTTDTCFRFQLPQAGPVAYLVVPVDSSSIFCDELDLTIALCDSQGIYYDSLLVIVEHGAYVDSYDVDDIGTLVDVFVAPDSEYCDTIVLHPVPGHEFSDGETVNITLYAMDTLMNASFPYEWELYIDLSAPVGTNFVPDSAGTTWDWQQELSARIWDEISELDTNAIEVIITDNGVPWLTYYWGDLPISYDVSDSTFHFSMMDAGSLWHEFHEYCIYIYVQDTTDAELYCPPNSDTIVWCFTIGDDDTMGPEIVFYENLPVADSCLWPAFDPTWAIECSLWDTSGVYDDDTDTLGQGIFVIVDTAGCPTLEPGGFLEIEQMELNPSGYPEGWAKTAPGAFDLYPPGVWVYFVIYAYDNDFDFDTTFDRALAISECGSCFFHDIEPPTVWAIDPQDGWFISCPCDSQKIEIGIHDFNGVNTFQGTLVVNGAHYPIGTSTQIQITGAMASPGTTYVTFTPDSCWQSGEVIDVAIYGITDVYWNTMEDTLSYSFTIDWQPPVVYYDRCPDTILYLDSLSVVEISVYDSLAGTDPTSIEVRFYGKRLNGDTYSFTYYIGDNGVEFIDSTQTLKLTVPILPGINIDNEDSLWISIEQACDLTESCAPNCITEPYVCMKFIAAEFECRSHPNPFTPDGNNINDRAFFDYPKRFFRDATVYIYDMQGVELRQIDVGPEHTYAWDGNDSRGNPCRPGIYLYVVEVNGEVICTGTVVLAR